MLQREQLSHSLHCTIYAVYVMASLHNPPIPLLSPVPFLWGCPQNLGILHLDQIKQNPQINLSPFYLSESASFDLVPTDNCTVLPSQLH